MDTVETAGISTLNSEEEEKILDAAFSLFSTKDIESVSLEDIAKKARVDEKTFGQLFETKQILAVHTATYEWKTLMDGVLPSLLKPKYKNASGFEQLETIFSLFVKLYKDHMDFLRFIYLFDSYVIKERIPRESMVNYEATILLVKQIISEALEKGIVDGTINEKYHGYGDILYFTLMHTFFSSAQKLALSGRMLDMDTKMNGAAQLTLLSQILLAGLK